jgi:uncharacterized protein (DUF433 family)
MLSPEFIPEDSYDEHTLSEISRIPLHPAGLSIPRFSQPVIRSSKLSVDDIAYLIQKGPRHEILQYLIHIRKNE